MTSTTPVESAARLRAALADRLTASGALADPAWRAAVAAVPREVFVPGWWREAGTVPPHDLPLWEPVTADTDAARWLAGVYDDATLITQFDGEPVDWSRAQARVGGSFTSSATLPSLVARMWEDAGIVDGADVLEIGTGTGYSTALACERLGSSHVTSVDVDGDVLDRAASALRALGFHPRIATADGLAGYWPAAPYDRVVAACSVRRIPRAWIDQTADGGRILTTLSGWLAGFTRVLLTVNGDTATGPLLPGTISFMMARAHAAPAPGNPYHWIERQKSDPSAGHRAAVHSPMFLSEATDAAFQRRFLAQLAAPNAQTISPVSDTEGAVLLVDTVTGSTASVDPAGADRWEVAQSGPLRIWDAIEDALDAWGHAGSPPPEAFTMTVDARGQRVGHPAAGLTFTLPT